MASVKASITPFPQAGTQQSRRLEYLDTLRGLMLVIMAVNHIPSPLHSITDHPLGFMSAAEGFVFLSGLMAGFVYTRKFLRGGWDALLHACLDRARTLYVYHLIGYALVFLVVGTAIFWTGRVPLDAPQQMVAKPLLALLVTGPLCIYQPALLDILPMYCGYMLLVPALVCACERGKRNWVLGLSLAIWTLANALCPQVPNALYLSVGAFNMCAWQVLFIAGIVFGHAWAHDQPLIKIRNGVFLWSVLVLCALLFAIRHALLSPFVPVGVLDWLTNKNNLAPLRLVNTVGIFILVRYVAAHRPAALSWVPLAFLGRASVGVFTVHVVAAYAINTNPGMFASSSTGQWLGTTLMLAAMASFAYLRYRAQIQLPATRRQSPIRV